GASAELPTRAFSAAERWMATRRLSARTWVKTDADVPEADAGRHSRGGLQKDQHAAGHQQLIDRRALEHRPDDEKMQQCAGDGGEESAEGGRERRPHACLECKVCRTCRT